MLVNAYSSDLDFIKKKKAVVSSCVFKKSIFPETKLVF